MVQSVEPRRRVHAGLNKAEVYNIAGQGDVLRRPRRDQGRSFELQRYRASGLKVTAAIVL